MAGADAAIAFGGVVVIWQCVRWLRDGVWTEIAVSHAVLWYTGATSVNVPITSWLGVQKILAWILDAPLSLSAVAVGLMILLCLVTRVGAWICAAALLAYVGSIFLP
jgi:hypothetical protein